MQKESLYVRAVRRFYGIAGQFDEYREQEINKIGNKSFMMLTIYNMLSVFVAWLGLMSSLDKELTFASYIICNFVVLLGIFGYIAIKVYRLKLDQVEVYNDTQYGQLMRKSKKSFVLGGLFFFVGTRVLSIIMNLVDAKNQLSLMDLVLSPKDNIQMLISTALFIIFMYILTKARIKKDE